jgi:hypothetical protein
MPRRFSRERSSLRRFRHRPHRHGEAALALPLGRFTKPRPLRTVRGTQLRETTLARPYVIRYRIAVNHVRILRVRHSERRPTNP